MLTLFLRVRFSFFVEEIERPRYCDLSVSHKNIFFRFVWKYILGPLNPKEGFVERIVSLSCGETKRINRFKLKFKCLPARPTTQLLLVITHALLLQIYDVCTTVTPMSFTLLTLFRINSPSSSRKCNKYQDR